MKPHTRDTQPRTGADRGESVEFLRAKYSPTTTWSRNKQRLYNVAVESIYRNRGHGVAADTVRFRL